MSSKEVAFITGVSSGLGTSLALHFLSAGYAVIGTVRSRSRAAKEVEAIETAGGKCLELDVTDAEVCWKVFAQAEGIYGKIDVLVNNAGMSWLGTVEDFT
jgi:3-oxoacyl-[acyl-carrier protein] reductase